MVTVENEMDSSMDFNRCNISTANDKKSKKELKIASNQAAMALSCMSHQMTDEEMIKLIEFKESVYRIVLKTKEGEYL